MSDYMEVTFDTANSYTQYHDIMSEGEVERAILLLTELKHVIRKVVFMSGDTPEDANYDEQEVDQAIETLERILFQISEVPEDYDDMPW